MLCLEMFTIFVDVDPFLSNAQLEKKNYAFLNYEGYTF